MPRPRVSRRRAEGAGYRPAAYAQIKGGLRSCIPFAKDVLGYYSNGLARVNSTLLKWFGRERQPEDGRDRYRSRNRSRFPCHMLYSLDKERRRRTGAAASNALVLMPCSNVKHAALLQGRHHAEHSKRSLRHRARRKLLRNFIDESKSRSRRITGRMESLYSSSNISVDRLIRDALSNGHSSTLTNTSSSEEDSRKIRCLTNTSMRNKPYCENNTNKNRRGIHPGDRNQACVMCTNSVGSKLIMTTDSPANLTVWPVGSHTQKHPDGSSSHEGERCLCTTLALPHYAEGSVAYYKRGPCRCGSSKMKPASKMLLNEYSFDIGQPPEKDNHDDEINLTIKSRNSLPHIEKIVSKLIESQKMQNLIANAPCDKNAEKSYLSKLKAVETNADLQDYVRVSKEIVDLEKKSQIQPKDINQVDFDASKAEARNSKIYGNSVDVSVGADNDTSFISYAADQKLTDSKRKSVSISVDDDFTPIPCTGIRKYSIFGEKTVSLSNDADSFTDYNRQPQASRQYTTCDSSCIPNESRLEDTQMKRYMDSACEADCNQPNGLIESYNRTEYDIDEIIEPNPSLRCDAAIDMINKNTASVPCSELHVEMKRVSVASINTIFGNIDPSNLKKLSMKTACSQTLLDKTNNEICLNGNDKTHEPSILLDDIIMNPEPDNNSKYTRNITIGYKEKRTLKDKVSTIFQRKYKTFDSCEGCDLRIQKVVRRIRPSINKDTNKIAIDTHVSSSKVAQAPITPNILSRVHSKRKIATKHDEWIQELASAKRVYPYSNYPNSETSSNSSSLKSFKRAMKNIKNGNVNSPENIIGNFPNANLKIHIKSGSQTKPNAAIFSNRRQRSRKITPALKAGSQDVIVLSPKPRYNCAEIIPASSCPIMLILPGGSRQIVLSDVNWLPTIMRHFDVSSNLESLSTEREPQPVKTYENDQNLILGDKPSQIIDMKNKKIHRFGLMQPPMLRNPAETSSSMVGSSPVFSSCNEIEPLTYQVTNDECQDYTEPKSLNMACDCFPFLSSNTIVHQPWCNSHLLSCADSDCPPTIIQTPKPKPLQDPQKTQCHRLFHFDPVDELQSQSSARPLSSTFGQNYFEHMAPTNYKHAADSSMHLLFQHALSFQPPLQKRCCVILRPYISHQLVLIDPPRDKQSYTNEIIKHSPKPWTKPVRSILVSNKPTKGPYKQKMICFEISPRPSLIIETYTAPPFSFCTPHFTQYHQETLPKFDVLYNNTPIIKTIRKVTKRHAYVIHPVRRYKCIDTTLPKPIYIINTLIIPSYSYYEVHLTALHQSSEEIQKHNQILINIPMVQEQPSLVLSTFAIQEIHLFGKLTCSFRSDRRQIQHPNIKNTLLTMNAKIERFPYATKLFDWPRRVKALEHFALDTKVRKPDRIVTSYVLHTSFRCETHLLCVQTCTFKITKRNEDFAKYLRHNMIVFLPKPLLICRILKPFKLCRLKETFVVQSPLQKATHLQRTHLNFSVFVQRWKKFVSASQMKLRALDRRNSNESNSHVDFRESAAAARLLPSCPDYVDMLTVSSKSSYLDNTSLNINDHRLIQNEICVETQTTGSMYRGISRRKRKLVTRRNPTLENLEVFLQPIIERVIFMYPLARTELHIKYYQIAIELQLPTDKDSCLYVQYLKDKNDHNYGSNQISDVTNQYRSKLKGNVISNDQKKAEKSFQTLWIKPNISTTSVMYSKISKYSASRAFEKIHKNLISKITDNSIESDAIQFGSLNYNKLCKNRGETINQIPNHSDAKSNTEFGSTNAEHKYHKSNMESKTFDGHKSISNVLIAANQTKWYRINDTPMYLVNNNHQNEDSTSEGSDNTDESFLKIVAADSNNRKAYLSENNPSERLLNTAIPNVEHKKLSSRCDSSSTDVSIKSIIATTLRTPFPKYQNTIYKNIATFHKDDLYRNHSPEDLNKSRNYLNSNLISNNLHDRKPIEKDIPSSSKDIDFLHAKFYTLNGLSGKNGETVVICDNGRFQRSAESQSCQPQKVQHSSTSVDHFLPLTPYILSSGSQGLIDDKGIKGICKVDNRKPSNYSSNRSYELTAKFKNSSTTTSLPCYETSVIPAKFKHSSTTTGDLTYYENPAILERFRHSSTTTGLLCYETPVIPTKFKNSSTTTGLPCYETPVLQHNNSDIRYERKSTFNNSLLTSENVSKYCISTNTDFSDISSNGTPNHFLRVQKSVDLSKSKLLGYKDTGDDMIRLKRYIFSPDESNLGNTLKSFNPQHQTKVVHRSTSAANIQTQTNSQCRTSISKATKLSHTAFGNIPVTKNSDGCVDEISWNDSISRKYPSEARILRAPQSKVNPIRHRSCYSSVFDNHIVQKKKKTRPKSFPSPSNSPIIRRQSAGFRHKLSSKRSSCACDSVPPYLFRKPSLLNKSSRPLWVKRSDCNPLSSDFDSNTRVLPLQGLILRSNSQCATQSPLLTFNPSPSRKFVCSQQSNIIFDNRKNCDTQTILDFTPSEVAPPICYQPSRSLLLHNDAYSLKCQTTHKFPDSPSNIEQAECRRVRKLTKFKKIKDSSMNFRQRQSILDIPSCQTQTSTQDEDLCPPTYSPVPSRQYFKHCQVQPTACSKPSELLIIKPRECSPRSVPSPPPRFDFTPCKSLPPVCKQPTDLLILKKSECPPPRYPPPPPMFNFTPCQIRPPVHKKLSEPPSMFDFAPCHSRPPACKKQSELLIIKRSECPPQRSNQEPPIFDFEPCQSRPLTYNRPSDLLLIKKAECPPPRGLPPPPMFNFKPCRVQPPVYNKSTELLLLKKRECPPPRGPPPPPMFNFVPCQTRLPICKPRSELLLLKKRECPPQKGLLPAPMFDFSPRKIQLPVCKKPSQLLLLKKFECPHPRAPSPPPMFDFKPCHYRPLTCNKPSELFLIKKNEYPRQKGLPPPSMFDFAPYQSRPPVSNQPSELLLIKKSDCPPPRNFPPAPMFNFNKPCSIRGPICPNSSELLLIKNRSCSTPRCNPQHSVFDFIPCNTDPSICTQTSQFNGLKEETQQTNCHHDILVSSSDYIGSSSPNIIRRYNQRKLPKRSHGKNIRPPVSQRARLKALVQKSFEVACNDQQMTPNYLQFSDYPQCSPVESVESLQSQISYRDKSNINDFNSLKKINARIFQGSVIPCTDTVQQLYQRGGKLEITPFNNRRTLSQNDSIEAMRILADPRKWSGICASQVEQPDLIILTNTNQQFHIMHKSNQSEREFLRDSYKILSRSTFLRPGRKSSIEPSFFDSLNRNLQLRRTPLSPIKGSSPSESSGSAAEYERTGSVKEYHRISSDEAEVSLIDLQAQNELKKDDSSQCSCSDCNTLKSENSTIKVASKAKIKESYSLEKVASPHEQSHNSINRIGYQRPKSNTIKLNHHRWHMNPSILKRSCITRTNVPPSKATWRHRQLTSRILQKYGYASGLIRSSPPLSLSVYPGPVERTRIAKSLIAAPNTNTLLFNQEPRFRTSFASCYNVSSQLIRIVETNTVPGNSIQSSNANIQLERKLSLITVPYDSEYDLLESFSVH